ncbi:unnamed protein product [Durusdinium trenchii]|uniref:Secreted protein n=1 Tax=Durusdinium trenchii TaxID=1381693 RepID=A0ABP0K5G1_9DINO
MCLVIPLDLLAGNLRTAWSRSSTAKSFRRCCWPISTFQKRHAGHAEKTFVIVQMYTSCPSLIPQIFVRDPCCPRGSTALQSSTTRQPLGS